MLRYLDRFECRDDEWRIVERRLVIGERHRYPILAPPEPENSDHLKQRRDFDEPYYLMRAEFFASQR